MPDISIAPIEHGRIDIFADGVLRHMDLTGNSTISVQPSWKTTISAKPDAGYVFDKLVMFNTDYYENPKTFSSVLNYQVLKVFFRPVDTSTPQEPTPAQSGGSSGGSVLGLVLIAALGVILFSKRR